MAVLRHLKGVVALIGTPLAAMFLTALVVQMIEPDSDGCRWCGWLMGGAGIVGLVLGINMAGRIWSAGRPSDETTSQRTGALVAGWFWVAICVAFIVIPAIASGEWLWALAAISIGGGMVLTLWRFGRMPADR